MDEVGVPDMHGSGAERAGSSAAKNPEYEELKIPVWCIIVASGKSKMWEK